MENLYLLWLEFYMSLFGTYWVVVIWMIACFGVTAFAAYVEERFMKKRRKK